MNSVSRFKRRVQRSGETFKEKALNEGIRNFRKTLRENPTCVKVQATIPDEISVTEDTGTILAMITDVALNDQRALDDKYIHVDIDENIDVGCYVKWQGIDWLLVYQEVNGFTTHKTFVMKRCNQIFRFKQNGIVYDIPVSATNLTLYSDGLADGVYLSRADAKRNIKFGSNPVTRSIDIGNRIMLTKKTVFKITHIDNFSYNGLVACIVGQVALTPKDDLENNIAYNPNSEKEDLDHPVDEVVIYGSDEIYLGGEEDYYTNHDDNVEWEVKDDSGCFSFNINKGILRLSTGSNSKLIGNSCEIFVKIDGQIVASKKITIIGYF